MLSYSVNTTKMILVNSEKSWSKVKKIVHYFLEIFQLGYSVCIIFEKNYICDYNYNELGQQ